MKNTQRFLLVGFLRNLYFYFPIFTLFLVDRDISMAAVVFSQTFYSLLQFIAEVPTGIFADKYGQKTSIVIGYFIEAIGIFTVMVWPTVIGLYLCYALGGLAMAFLSGSEEALLYESAKREKTNYQKAYAAFLSMQTWGMVVGTMLSGLIVYAFGAASYWYLMAATVISLVICSILSLSQRSYSATIAAEESGAGFFEILKKSASLIRKNDTVLNLTIGGMLTLTGEYYLLSVYQPIFLESGVPIGFIGIAFSVGLIISALLVRRVGILEKYLTLDKIILAVSIALSIGYAAIGLTHWSIGVVVAFLFLRGIMEIQTPIVSDYINEHIPSNIRSTTLSGVSLMSRFAAVLQRIILSFAVIIGGVRLSLLTQSAYLLIGGLLAFYLFRRCGCVHRIKPREA